MKRWHELTSMAIRMNAESLKKHPERSLPLRKLYRGGKVPIPGFCPWNVQPTIVGDLLTGPKLAYRIEAAGYWFEDEEVKDA
jgi:hypothetical protein